MTNVLFTQDINDAIGYLRCLSDLENISDLENELDYIENDLNALTMNLRMTNLIELYKMGYLSHDKFKEIVAEYLQRD